MTHPLTHRPARRVLLAALGVEIIGIAWLVLSPSSTAADSVTLALSRLLQAAGAPAILINIGLLEVLLNVWLFVPLGVTLALVVPSLPWWMWALVGLTASSSLEAVQLLFLSARTATLRDIAANTFGLIVGTLLVASWLRLHNAGAQREGAPSLG